MTEPMQQLVTVTAGATAISTSVVSSMKVSESLLSASIEQIAAGAYVVQLSDITGIAAFSILFVKAVIDISKYIIKKINSEKS